LTAQAAWAQAGAALNQQNAVKEAYAVAWQTTGCATFPAKTARVATLARTTPHPTRRDGAMRRWVRCEAPVMVCVDIDEDGYQGKVVNVVLATEHDDIALARDHRGHSSSTTST
jgi:hypothetical protein